MILLGMLITYLRDQGFTADKGVEDLDKASQIT